VFAVSRAHQAAFTVLSLTPSTAEA